MFQKKSGLEKIMNNRGCHFFPSEFFRPTVPQNFVGEAFLFQKISGMEKNMKNRGVARFYVDNFLSHMPKNFVGEHFCVLENVWFEKNMSNKWGVSCFFDGSFFTLSAEKFCGEPLNVSETLGYRKVLCIIGGITIFRPMFSVSFCPKTS